MKIAQRYWRYRWHGLTLATCIAIVGWAVVEMQPDTYEATTQVYVGTNSSIEVLSRRLASEGRQITVLDLVKESLLDTQQLEGVVMAAGVTRVSSPENTKAQLTDRVIGKIQIVAVAKWDNLFRISYLNSDRQKALAVVEAFIAAISENAIEKNENEEGNESFEHDAEYVPGFRVIEPPTVETTPLSKSRSIWMAVILASGITAGGFLSYWLNLRNPVFDNLGTMNAINGLPVVAIVTHAWMPRARARRRRELIVFGIAAAALLLCYMGVLTF